ncbi:MAG: peptide-methionine (S)-S-oxide reductase [Legionella sp.]|nr:MAG: peptide-methionine (S)-S-oxide reductase [Legionella sp.]
MMYLDKTDSLTPEARRIICEHATERPHSGAYNAIATDGTYLCRRCGWALFRASSQFSAGCGWPSFDEDVSQRVKEYGDPDGQRTEIRCGRCDAHLGHVFLNEQWTATSRRYCVNSVSLDFVIEDTVLDTSEAIVAGGCFWGVDYYLRQIPGVLNVEVGYIGGATSNPTYAEVCTGQTGHYEAARVLFDKTKTNYQTVVERFFEIHDPTQVDGQGADRALRYQSAVFTYDTHQSECVRDLIRRLENNGYDVATTLYPVTTFWPAEAYHQEYYTKHASTPYCHQRVLRFSSDHKK